MALSVSYTHLLPKYEQELANLKKNIAMLKAQAAGTYKMKAEDIKPLKLSLIHI